MMRILLSLLITICTLSALAEVISFDADELGRLPRGWRAGTTGEGSPRWTVEKDSTAPSGPHVLRQSGQGQFPWCVKPDVKSENGYVEVKFKPISGREDQAGGVVWRWKDGENYYVARANALENNVALYYTRNGNRHTLQYVDAPVASNQWHILRVEFAGTHIKVFLDGKLYIEREDDHLSGAGAVGVWTKADSVTAFDDFTYGLPASPPGSAAPVGPPRHAASTRAVPPAKGCHGVEPPESVDLDLRLLAAYGQLVTLVKPRVKRTRSS